MSERDAVSVLGEVGDQVEHALDFGCNGDDPYLAPSRGNFAENVGARKVSGARFTWRADAGLRLRPLEVGADEIAFEMGRKHARRARRSRFPGNSHRVEHLAQRLGRARDGRRAESGHAEWGEPRGYPPDRVRPVERIRTRDSVDMDVDEAGDDEVTFEIASVTGTAGLDFGDVAVVDGDAAGSEQ